MNNAIGSTTLTTSAAALMINGCMTGGMAELSYDCATLSKMCDVYSNMAIPSKFSLGCTLRANILQQISKVYRCPFACSVCTTVPCAMDFIESNIRSGNGTTSFEFNVMRTVDFIGRNYLLFTLPEMNCTEVMAKSTDGRISELSNPHNCYLGAWHRDLVPRIIRSLSFYSRANNHVLFEYSGHDIYIFNAIFGSAQRDLNDILAGEDKFELAYDPYYVNGAALGLASFKGIDPFEGYVVQSNGSVETKEIMNYLQVDTTMDKQQFREFYRRGVWFETPVARNAFSRHSIHSRRVIHKKKDLWIPLDILPFGYSIASSIPIGAVHGEVGYIHLDIHHDWLDRSFYLTRLSDIPSVLPMPQHRHYGSGDSDPAGTAIGGSDPRIGWVNEASINRFADPAFNTPNAQLSGECATEGDRAAANLFGTIAGGAAGHTEVNTNMAGSHVVPTPQGGLAGFATQEGLYTTGNHGQYVSRFAALEQRQKKADLTEDIEVYIHTLSHVCPEYYERTKNALNVRLIQVGYKTIACVRDLINKLPNIYLATEWADSEFGINCRNHIEVLNDLYIQCLVLMFLPKDSNGIESIRVYPNHLIDHEQNIIHKLHVSNENGQAQAIYTWEMLNAVTPSVMGMEAPLPENMGIVPFAPKLVANDLPYGFYDTNINGQLRLDFIPFEHEAAFDPSTVINMRHGRLIVAPIGINGLALANLNFYRCIY